MDVREKRVAIDDIIYLLRCAIRQEAPDRERVEAMNLELVYEEAEWHKLAAAVGMALELAGVVNGRFVQAVAMAQRKAALLDADKAAVLERLEAAGIWYMPLKGAILKDLYPRFGMREMSDIDILFDKTRAEDVKGIMEGLGFTTKKFDRNNDDDYYKLPVSYFEMHKALFSEAFRSGFYHYYEDVKKRLIPDEGKKYAYHFSDEDFYIYLTTHEYKHYTNGGTGLRSLLDTYVFLTHKALDTAYVQRETKKLGVAEFERKNRELAFHLFDKKELTEEEQGMLDYMISSGTYGMVINRVNNEISQKGLPRLLLSKLYVPRKQLELMFPILKRKPYLFPVCWLLRLLSGILFYIRLLWRKLKAALGLGKKKHE